MTIDSGCALAAAGTEVGHARRLLHFCAKLLVAVTWLSGALFGAYILLFFGGTSLGGVADRWNGSLAGLHDAANPWATFAIAAHFLTGGILLILGPLQLIGRVRRAWPRLHRWLGRLYVGSAAVAGLAGLAFIGLSGTIGGPIMNVGFGIYGGLMVLAAARTFAHARARRIEAHNEWAVRLFALTIGSWLYRMEYGFWFLAMGRLGHTSTFDGWFDAIMAFLFYLPNLVVAEAFLRTRHKEGGAVTQLLVSLVLIVGTIFVVLATWVFLAKYWGPGMTSGISAL